MAGDPVSIFERLEVREAQEEARRQAVWRWAQLGPSLLFCVLVVMHGSAVVSALFRTVEGQNGPWLDQLARIPRSVLIDWAGWVSMGAYAAAIAFESLRPGHQRSQLNVALILVFLSCEVLKSFLEHQIVWAVGSVAIVMGLLVFGDYVWRKVQPKPGRLMGDWF